ncbi:MAG TPA: class I SAM-dependent methyltransferase [Terriglobales bacterium]|jgi:SAM-dependent methyltransferase
MSSQPNINLWSSPQHALEYLSRADSIPHRTEGEATLLECLPAQMNRVLDLGSGDGRLLGLVKLARPNISAIALDFSTAMLVCLKGRFASAKSVQVIDHDLQNPLPHFGKFDAVVSSFAIHHLTHERKRALYAEIYAALNPGGVFCNLEHVASSTNTLHAKFLESINQPNEDPSNKLLDLHQQLLWLREIGFKDVDCLWKWRELALMTGAKPRE